MNAFITEQDRILSMVLSDPELFNRYGYDPNDYNSLDQALLSSNHVVKTVANIIQGVKDNRTSDEVYKQVFTELTSIL